MNTQEKIFLKQDVRYRASMKMGLDFNGMAVSLHSEVGPSDKLTGVTAVRDEVALAGS